MIHPFFTASRSTPSKPDDLPESSSATSTPGVPSPQRSLDDAADEDLADNDDFSSEQDMRQRKRRKMVGDGEDEEAMDNTPRIKKQAKLPVGGNIADHFKRLHIPVPSPSPVQSPPGTVRDPEAEQPTVEVLEASPGSRVVLSLPHKQDPETKTDVEDKEDKENKPDEPKPKRILQFNRLTGTIGSPPKPKHPAGPAEGVASKPRRGRPRKKFLVTIQYGKDVDSRRRVGDQICKILAGDLAISLEGIKSSSDVASRPKSRPVNRASVAPKNAHPFFSAKAAKLVDGLPTTSAGADVADAKPQPPQSPLRPHIFSSTPCSPKKRHVPGSNAAVSSFGARKFGLKVPGAQQPAWPWKDMVHVRGENIVPYADSEMVQIPLPLRKSKGYTVCLPERESLLSHLTGQIDIPILLEEARLATSDDFQPPPAELRLPQKHFESGQRLMQRVQSQLRCIKRVPPRIDQGLSHLTVNPEQIVNTTANSSYEAPPAIRSLYSLAHDTLSAFDKSQCETACWTHKYAPVSAADIIQPGREAFFLKEWLQKLMVQSVDTGASDGQRVKAAPKAKPKKRKKLDGFIVSTDEEDNEMDEISDDDGDFMTPRGSQALGKKTVMRAGDRAGKKSKDGKPLANTVIISGSHGCGKTAAVYAVAKELDFEVFEVNPGSRRAGKDVLEKIGDMTRNHLVHQQGPKVEGDNDAAPDLTAIDIQSGRQATMISFFKTKAPAKPKNLPKTVSAPPTESKKVPTKPQKQSLILLDEADILFEEDKQFWSTVMGIISQSKRPFIITCNDESLIPVQGLNLHAIFRFCPPQADLAIDRMLLIAACEGHALERHAVEALYHFRGGDLRASLMDLNYWCQIGVGDRRGGFDWFVLRWPRGVDRDEDGHVVRVMSEGTYQSGMGSLSHDAVTRTEVGDDSVKREENILEQLWDSWRMDAGACEDSSTPDDWARGQDGMFTQRGDRLACLELYERFVDTLSAADICSMQLFALDNQEPLDPTLPDLPPRIREDYIAGRPLLDALPAVHQETLGLSISFSLKSLARKNLQSKTALLGNGRLSEPAPLDEQTAIRHIQNRFTKANPAEIAISPADFGLAFERLAAGDAASIPGTASCEPSLFFDRPLVIVAQEVAPYVRGIVAYDARLAKQRMRLSSLLSEGGRGPQKKKMRTTRSAFSAMEGGERKTTRGDRWFKADLNPYLVMRTGGRDWDKVVVDAVGEEQGEQQQEQLTLQDENGYADTDGEVSGKVRNRGIARKRVVSESEDELGADGDATDKK